MKRVRVDIVAIPDAGLGTLSGIFDVLRARTLSGQQGETAIVVAVLTRMIRTAKPVSVHTA
jgi:hypothetical protein